MQITREDKFLLFEKTIDRIDYFQSNPETPVLTEDEKILVHLRDEQYGSWDAMVADLESRMKSIDINKRKAVFITDIALIKRGLQVYETNSGKNLADYVTKTS